jgi:hypothetical protein
MNINPAIGDRMLISEKLIFIELQKTVRRTSRASEEGGRRRDDGKHNVPSEDTARGAGSRPPRYAIRGPGTVAVVVWLPAEGRALRAPDQNEKKWRKMLDKGAAGPMRPSPMRARGQTGEAKGKAKVLRTTSRPKGEDLLYADPDNAGPFRDGCRPCCRSRPLRKCSNPGTASRDQQGRRPDDVRYFTLCTRNGENVDKSVSTLEGLRNYDKENCFIDYFVRKRIAGRGPDQGGRGLRHRARCREEKLIRERRRPTSRAARTARSTPTTTRAVQLVARREKFIIEKFGYKNAKREPPR